MSLAIADFATGLLWDGLKAGVKHIGPRLVKDFVKKRGKKALVASANALMGRGKHVKKKPVIKRKTKTKRRVR
jgi:hypothetical protein